MCFFFFCNKHEIRAGEYEKYCDKLFVKFPIVRWIHFGVVSFVVIGHCARVFFFFLSFYGILPTYHVGTYNSVDSFSFHFFLFFCPPLNWFPTTAYKLCSSLPSRIPSLCIISSSSLRTRCKKGKEQKKKKTPSFIPSNYYSALRCSTSNVYVCVLKTVRREYPFFTVLSTHTTATS